MVSFFKNLFKSNNQKDEINGKRINFKWPFLLKKSDKLDQMGIANVQEDNQNRIKNTNSASSIRSITISDNSISDVKIHILPKMKREHFLVPKYIPSNEWIKSQVFEAIHLISKLVDLVSANNSKLAKSLEDELDQILTLIEQEKDCFKDIFIKIFLVIESLYEEEINLWIGLKFEAHLNSLIVQLVELCYQLPENLSAEISGALTSKQSSIDLSSYRQILMNWGNNSNSAVLDNSQ